VLQDPSNKVKELNTVMFYLEHIGTFPYYYKLFQQHSSTD